MRITKRATLVTPVPVRVPMADKIKAKSKGKPPAKTTKAVESVKLPKGEKAAKTPTVKKGTKGAKDAKVLHMGSPEPIADTNTPPEIATNMDNIAAAVMAGKDPGAIALTVAQPDWVAPHPVGATVLVPIETVDTNPAHNGRSLDLAKVKEYAADFAKRISMGLEPQLQECTGFYPRGEDKLRLVFGFHRAAAVGMYNKTHTLSAPLWLRVRIVDDMSIYNALIDNWAENKHHNSLSPVAEMRYMQRLRDVHGLEQKAIAKSLGVSPTLVSLRLQLERLDVGTLKMVESGVLPIKSAYALAGMEDVGKREKALEKVREIFDRLGDADAIKGMKVPKVAIVAQAVAEAEGQGEGEGINPDSTAGTPAAPVSAAPMAPKRLAVGKIETTLVEVVKHSKTPAEVRTVLRAVLGWVLGQRTPAAMVATVAKALGYDPKVLAGVVNGGAVDAGVSAAGAAVGEGGEGGAAGQ